jgi:YHS domain-containing protein
LARAAKRLHEPKVIAPMLRRALPALLLALPALALARSNTEQGIAVRGTDVVAYFNEGRPRTGRAEFAHEWDGARWLFASAEHRDAFASNPARYAPAFGGFCAWAVSQGYTAPIDPAAWRIVEGRLYLNYDRNVQRRWERDIPGHIARANANWPGLAAR